MKLKIKYFVSAFVLISYFMLTHISCSHKILMGEKLKHDSAVFKFVSTVKDFGFIKEGYSPTYNFEFINIGNKPLIISNIEPGCSCTTSEFSKNPVLPNAKGNIKIIFNSEGNAGSMNKSITIFSNATEPEKKLYIKGKVVSMGGR